MKLTTPESVIKAKIKEILKRYNVYYLMPVQQGIGASGLDYHCVVGVEDIPIAFFVEAKRWGKYPTDRQDVFIETRLREQNARTFVIDGDDRLKGLEQWLEALKQLGLKALLIQV